MVEAQFFASPSSTCVSFLSTSRWEVIRKELATTTLAVIEIDGSTIASKPQLMEALARAMQFPSWFGHNWDALDECLRDLPPESGGWVVCIESAVGMWQRIPRESGMLVSCWLSACSHWSTQRRAFHLVFCVADTPLSPA